MMKIEFIRTHIHYGTRYHPGDQIEVSQEAAERLVREGVARVRAAELMRHLRGKRRTMDTAAAPGDFKIRRGG